MEIEHCCRCRCCRCRHIRTQRNLSPHSDTALCTCRRTRGGGLIYALSFLRNSKGCTCNKRPILRLVVIHDSYSYDEMMSSASRWRVTSQQRTADKFHDGLHSPVAVPPFFAGDGEQREGRGRAESASICHFIYSPSGCELLDINPYLLRSSSKL